MTQCKRIRENISGHLDIASERGISKKLLRLIVKERGLERKINDLHDVLEPDEQSELEMLTEKLGDFANTPLGGAASPRRRVLTPSHRLVCDGCSAE